MAEFCEVVRTFPLKPAGPGSAKSLTDGEPTLSPLSPPLGLLLPPDRRQGRLGRFAAVAWRWRKRARSPTSSGAPALHAAPEGGRGIALRGLAPRATGRARRPKSFGEPCPAGLPRLGLRGPEAPRAIRECSWWLGVEGGGWPQAWVGRGGSAAVLRPGKREGAPRARRGGAGGLLAEERSSDALK